VQFYRQCKEYCNNVIILELEKCTNKSIKSSSKIIDLVLEEQEDPCQNILFVYFIEYQPTFMYNLFD